MNPEQLQQAVYAALNVAGITSLLGTGGIVNEWAGQVLDSSDPAPFPFVTFSFPASVPFETKDGTGQRSVVQVDVWSRVNTSQVKTIAGAVYEALHRQALAVTGHISTELTGMDFSRDPDGITRRGMLRFEVVAL